MTSFSHRTFQTFKCRVSKEGEPKPMARWAKTLNFIKFALLPLFVLPQRGKTPLPTSMGWHGRIFPLVDPPLTTMPKIFIGLCLISLLLLLLLDAPFRTCSLVHYVRLLSMQHTTVVYYHADIPPTRHVNIHKNTTLTSKIKIPSSTCVIYQ